MERNRFFHILWSGNAFFNVRIIKLIANPSNGFIVCDHTFVVNRQHLLDEIKNELDDAILDDINIIYVEKTGADLINYCSRYANWIFVHGMCGILEALKINLKTQRKIIWRTWGHDVEGFRIKENSPIKNAIKITVNILWRKEVQRFKYVGVNNEIDELMIRRKFGSVNTVRMPYPDHDDYYLTKKATNQKLICDERLLVLVGHSGTKNDKHIEIIESLSKYPQDSLLIIVPLSYGDKKYIEEIIDYVASNQKNNVLIIDKEMPYGEYSKLLSSINVAILAGEYAYALANISQLVFYKKSFYLDENGVIAKAFDQNNIPFRSINTICNASFEEFSENQDYSLVSASCIGMQTYSDDVSAWKLLVGLLE